MMGALCYWSKSGNHYEYCFRLQKGTQIRVVTLKSNHIERAKQALKRLHPGFKMQRLISLKSIAP